MKKILPETLGLILNRVEKSWILLNISQNFFMLEEMDLGSDLVQTKPYPGPFCRENNQALKRLYNGLKVMWPANCRAETELKSFDLMFRMTTRSPKLQFPFW